MRIDLPLAGRTRAVQVRIPAVGEVVPLILDKDLRSPGLVEMSLAMELQALVESIDGGFLSEDTAREIVREPEALASLLRARNDLYNHNVERGRLLARCPHCKTRDVQLDLLFYWKTLNLPVWNFFEDGVLMALPKLSGELPLGQRPSEPPPAMDLRYEYPGAAGSLEGTLGSVSTDPARILERENWERNVDSVEEQPDGRSHWRRSSPGFRATLRLATAVHIKPEEVESLPMPMFLFLDLMHFATSNVEIRPDSGAVLVCSACGGRFLPVIA